MVKKFKKSYQHTRSFWKVYWDDKKSRGYKANKYPSGGSRNRYKAGYSAGYNR